MGNGLHRVPNAFLSIAKTLEPCFEIDPAVMHHVDVILRHSGVQHMLNHAFRIHVLCAAVAMPDYHYGLDAQFENSYQQASDNASKGVGNYPSCVLDYLRVAVFQAERCRKELSQARVHTANNSQLFIGILIGFVRKVAFFFNEGFVMLKNLVYDIHTILVSFFGLDAEGP